MFTYIASLAKENKKGQAVMEYSMLFLVVGLGMLYAMSYFQSNMEIDLGMQAQTLMEVGRKLL